MSQTGRVFFLGRLACLCEVFRRRLPRARRWHALLRIEVDAEDVPGIAVRERVRRRCAPWQRHVGGDQLRLVDAAQPEQQVGTPISRRLPTP